MAAKYLFIGYSVFTNIGLAHWYLSMNLYIYICVNDLQKYVTDMHASTGTITLETQTSREYVYFL